MGTLGSLAAQLGAFWWEFIVGDDRRVAAGVVAALAVTAGSRLAAAITPAWWFLPATVLVLLGVSLRRGIPRQQPRLHADTGTKASSRGPRGTAARRVKSSSPASSLAGIRAGSSGGINGAGTVVCGPVTLTSQQ